MSLLPSLFLWRAEGLKLSRQPLAWTALGTLALVLLVTSVSAGLDARSWRAAAAGDVAERAEALNAAVQQFRQGPAPGPAAAVATYRLGRGDLGLTRMAGKAGLALGIARMHVLPVQLRASLENRIVDARAPGPLRNPLLSETGLPGLPSMVALLLPLVALVLCAGFLQEEREHGRLGLLRVQSRGGIWPLVCAALGWRFIVLWSATAIATLPALVLDPGASLDATLCWLSALAAFALVWVVLGGLLSWAPVSGASSMLLGLGCWLMLTFAVPAGLALTAQQQSPMPSRLASIVALRAAQQESEAHEGALAAAWYARHPGIAAQLPAVWPASFLPRALAQQRQLAPMVEQFRQSRLAQASFMQRWAWLSPGLALVLYGERLAGTDAASHERYCMDVDAFEARWRDFLVPRVMDRLGIRAEQLVQLPRFSEAMD